MQKNKGFTLIELIVTIAVLAVISGFAAPSFTDMIRRNQLNGDTREFINSLTETRSEAIFKQQDRKLTLNGSGGFKNWADTDHIKKSSGAAAIEFNRMGQSTETDSSKRCFVFEHLKDVNLKSYVYVQKGGTVLYSKAAVSCNYEKEES